MGLFESKPYKINNLNPSEIAALCVALDIGVKVAEGTALGGLLKKARRHVDQKAFTLETLLAATACLEATIESIVHQDPTNLRSSMLLQYMAMQAAFESALAKLKRMA